MAARALKVGGARQRTDKFYDDDEEEDNEEEFEEEEDEDKVNDEEEEEGRTSEDGFDDDDDAAAAEDDEVEMPVSIEHSTQIVSRLLSASCQPERRGVFLQLCSA